MSDLKSPLVDPSDVNDVIRRSDIEIREQEPVKQNSMQSLSSEVDAEAGEIFPKLLEENAANLDKASEYDYCMVFPVDKQTGGLTKDGRRFLRKMQSYGLDIFCFFGSRKNYVFAMIRLSLQKLRALADQLEFKMLLDEEKLKERAAIGYPDLGIAPIDILHDPEETPLRPYQNIYAKYRDEVDEELYWRPKDLTHPFRSASACTSFLCSD